MRRREFIALAGGASVWPLAAVAQQPAGMKHIAIVHPDDKVGNMTVNGGRAWKALFEKLGDHGYVEGDNLLVDRYSGQGRTENYSELARDVVGTKPDLIFSSSLRLALNFKAATTTIPIVAVTNDPVVGGLVTNIARPEANITGVSVDAGAEIWGKRLGLLVETTSKSSNARFLCSQLTWERPSGEADMVREAARLAGIPLAGALLGSTIDETAYQRVFESMEQDRVDAIVVSDESEHLTHRAVLAELAAKSRIPAIFPFKVFVELGGLLAYSVDIVEIARDVADVIDKILKGTRPRDIPFYQQTKFELIVNLKTAKVFGIGIPPNLLALADQVIE
jgi:putative ABC transport system substrate-binding protein